MTPVTNLPSGGAAIFWGVITFSLLIVLHEGGHFLAARAFGLRVHEFMLGLPSPGLRWKSRRSGVTYGVTMLPLGGYVRIAGMEPGTEDELLAAALGRLLDAGRIDAADLASALSVPRERASALLTTLEDYGAAAPVPDSMDWAAQVTRESGQDDETVLARLRDHVYRGLPTWKRITVLGTGIVINIVSAYLILVLALMAFGVPRATTTVDAVATAGPAAVAGVQPGDRIISFGGTPVATWEQLKAILAKSAPAAPEPMAVRRGSATVTLQVVPDKATGGGAYLGVIAKTAPVPMGAGEALSFSFTTLLGVCGLIVTVIAHLFNPATFRESVSGLRSVVGASYMVAQAAEQGPLDYAWMVALLSLSLGIMNVIPIPPLDGGKIAVELVERVFRRPLPRKVTIGFSVAGTVLLFSLIFYLMYADVVRYIIKG